MLYSNIYGFLHQLWPGLQALGRHGAQVEASRSSLPHANHRIPGANHRRQYRLRDIDAVVKIENERPGVKNVNACPPSLLTAGVRTKSG